MLRIAGVRQADVKGYSFAREDVNARSLANGYAQTLGQVFTHEMKPYEVEILVAQVATDVAEDELFHILYDGTVMDEEGFTVLGGQADTIREALRADYQPTIDLAGAVQLGAKVLGSADQPSVPGEQLEVAVLERGKERRAFRRLKGADLDALLATA
jgi:proteasome alpha subunit